MPVLEMVSPDAPIPERYPCAAANTANALTSLKVAMKYGPALMSVCPEAAHL